MDSDEDGELEFGRPVPVEKIDAFRNTHYRNVRASLLRHQSWRVQSNIQAQFDEADTGARIVTDRRR